MTSKNGESLSPEELNEFRAGKCPDCGSNEVRPGPRGGLSRNIYCASLICGSRFNEMGPFGVERISDKSPGHQRPTWGQA